MRASCGRVSRPAAPGGKGQKFGFSGASSYIFTLSMISCVLAENQAWRGGAIYAEGGDLVLHLCRLVVNTATGEGGAIFHATAGLVLDNCLLAGNSAGSDGGAVFSDLAQVHATNCSFRGNTSAGRGGAWFRLLMTSSFASWMSVPTSKVTVSV